MIANHVHDALTQVKRLQELILGKKYFSGYLWQPKIIGGLIVLAGSLIMASPYYPQTIPAHLSAWGLIIFCSMVINYAGLFYWFLYDKTSKRQWVRLLPAVDMLPEIAVCAVFTLVMIQEQQYERLMGIWLCMYGLVHVSYRQALPTGAYVVGVFYIAWGALFLFLHLPFTDSLLPGIIICAGETACGIILYKNRRQLNNE
jgi:hypothetical protein